MTAIARNSSIPLKIQKQLGGWLSHQNDFYFCEGCPSVPRSPRNALERANKVCQYSHCKPVTVTDDSVDLKGKYIRSFVVVGNLGLVLCSSFLSLSAAVSRPHYWHSHCQRLHSKQKLLDCRVY